MPASQPAKSPPLRPAGVRYVLVCEGISDQEFLQQFLSSKEFEKRFPGISEISVYGVEGKQNVGPLAAILWPSVWVKDRDFDISVEEAQNSLNSRRRETYWTCFDIEGYLLYPDWLFEAMRDIQKSPKGRGNRLPDEQEIVRDLLAVAARLALEHAGKHTVQQLAHLTGPHWKYRATNPDHGDQIDQIDQAAWQAAWETHLAGEANRLVKVGRDLAALSELSAGQVVERFHHNLHQYRAWATRLDTIRVHFSGKRMFETLALHWQWKGVGWETIRNKVQQQALGYSQAIQGSLSDDLRLGDMGLLASKVLGRRV